MQILQDNSFYSGLSGLQLSIPKNLYPSPFENSSRLTYYSSINNSIEFNSSFYKIPNAVTVAKWADSVPDNFRFTFKLWKGITHQKGLNFNTADVEQFFEAINSVKNKKGCLLIQLPPGLGRENIVQLDRLLGCIKEFNHNPGWLVAVEFRNKSWYRENVYDLLNYYRVAMVIHDMPNSATPFINQKSSFVYIRFHGPSGNYRDSYSESYLLEYAHYMNECIESGKAVYVYFNNTMGDAINNVRTLNDLLYDGVVKV